MQLKSTFGPRVMLSRFTIKFARQYASNWFNYLVVLSGKVKQLLFQKEWEINAVLKKRDSNCIGFLSATA